ncbi:FKBP-type peptidyl-prolyl cis-trans isomerase [Sphingobacterium sp. SYP-B4668]|uniref:FKBP-type peptidyl-prolyl cis-trans isomerase n=1 Tax=Sphingobacterium sp. SYP-B4668 TaxID=2996035 RepID=UPI0022DE6682|nr:FKBP-type peptidyl-prolyl cis-trans isomerase [Sphingobacterium sp. SYP-B4668]
MAASTKYLKKIKDLAAKNLQEGITFLQENGKRSTVITTLSGLQYEVLNTGTGLLPSKTSKIVCHYSGQLLDGTVFDSSYKRKRPETFEIKDLIAGWQEALLLMPVGSRWRVYIPHDKAYGFQSLTTTSGGNCTLIFEMELLGVL